VIKKEIARNRVKAQAEKERLAEVKKCAPRATLKKERDAQLKADNLLKIKQKEGQHRRSRRMP
jgi:hypothetical protein